jgi:hypothetical protein
LTGCHASVTGNQMAIHHTAALLIAMGATVGIPSPSAAIEIHPTQAQIRGAIERGTNAAAAHRSPDTFYARFGSADGLHPSGYLVTKLGGMSVMATHMALRGIQSGEAEIAHVLEASTMLISVVIVGDQPSFAENSYMVLDQGGQGGRVIKPVTVRADGQAGRSAVWPESPRFKARIVALFSYSDFDPAAQTTITVFPASGGEISFSIDFAQID